MIARDYRREIMFSLCAAMNFVGSIDLVEACALWRAMEICSDLNL